MEIGKELKQIRKEQDIAVACGYDFVVGVSTEEHKAALEFAVPGFEIVVTGCKR